MIRTNIVIAAGLFAATLPAIPAQATGVARTFVSAAGSDSNNCANVLTPCRHLATAYAATAADGEIYVLDPANYGSLIITGPVSIEGHGWASIAPVSGQAAITINAPGATDKINIIGVVLDGTALTGTTGIQFNSGGSLNIQDSVIRNFTDNGINFTPNASSQLSVSNTLVSDNAGHGIYIDPTSSGTTTGVLDHVEMENNKNYGLYVTTSTQTFNFTVSDSVSSGNENGGVYCYSFGSPLTILVRNSTIANNLNGFVSGGSSAQILVTRSAITGNFFGWSTNNSGTVTSYADNNIVNNANGNGAPPSAGGYK